MIEDTMQTPGPSPLKRALLAIEDLRAKLDAAKRGRRNPIAVIGLGCRIPGGANSPEEFWELLREGRSGVREIPADRWDVECWYDPNPEAIGKINTRFGAFLDRVDQFEPRFFGISPREALTMDPQQRLLLEVSWEALEHAGQSPTKLGKSRTGVYFGICTNDYAQRVRDVGDPSLLDMHFMSGIAHSIASGRLSYFLGLQGPSLSVDTACSSSLVAFHLACQGLRNDECRMALAGGVNVILSPDSFVTMSRSGMLAADGKCKTFDDAADGFVRGEGCGVVVLKRLEDALADGDSILALIRGSAVNQDGPSSGLTVPNGPSQESVIRNALSNAGVSAQDVSYIEAHGTGTALGDPIEIQALGAVFGEGRDKSSRLQIGSLKTNVGHLEAAAGIAGLIKVVLSLQAGEIPRHLNVTLPSRHIAWERLPIDIVTERISWAPINGKLIAGVSSFGFSGTNAHVVLEKAPAPALRTSQTGERSANLLVLSAMTESALRTASQRAAQRIEESKPGEIGDICYTANAGRAHFSHRLAVTDVLPSVIAEKLRQFAAGKTPSDVAHGLWEGSDQPKIAFLFSGEASHYQGEGRELYENSPVFQRAFDRCDRAVQAQSSYALKDALYALPGANSDLPESRFTNSLWFALEYAICEMLRSWGVQPTFVLGAGVGEFAAACSAGVFSPEDGLPLIAQHGLEAHVLDQAAKKVEFAAPLLRVVSNRTGNFAATSEIATAAYWHEQTQMPGELESSFETLATAGCTVFVEIGSIPLLLEADRKIVDANGALCHAPMQLGPGEWPKVLHTLSQLYVHGVDVDWAEFSRKDSRRKVSFPTYPFERERFMVDPPSRRISRLVPGETQHPLVERRLETPSLKDIVFETRLTATSPAFVEGHRVFGTIVLPGAGYLEAVRAAAEFGLGANVWTIEDFTIGEALAIGQSEEKRLQVVLTRRDDGTARFKVLSAAQRAGGESTVWRTHATGALRPAGSTAATERLDIEALQRGAQQLDPEPFYGGYERRGIGFGEHFLGVRRVWCRTGLAVGLVEAPPVTAAESACYGIHPALLDACIQVVAATYGAEAAKDSEQLFMPIGIETFTLFARPAGKLWSVATLETAEQGAQTVRASIRVANEQGKVIAEFRGMSFKRAERSMLERAIGKTSDHWLYKIGWEALPEIDFPSRPIEASSSEARRWLILADQSGTGEQLAKRLEDLGDQCTLAFAHAGEPACNGALRMDATSRDVMEKLIRQFLAGSTNATTCVVYLWPLDAQDIFTLDASQLEREGRSWCGGALHLLQSLVRNAGVRPPRLWLCTRGSQKAHETDTTVSPVGTTVWGLGKVIALEHPELVCTRIDLAAGSAGDQIGALVAALHAADGEDQVALRAGRRWGARLRPAAPETANDLQSMRSLAGSANQLTFTERGSIDNLTIVSATRSRPAPGEVEIRVHATGLNFRDVMNVMDLYPGDPGPLGIECAGTITAVGEGITEFVIGNAVVAIARGSFSAYVITSAELVARKPTNLSFAEAAAIPVAYVTADLTLNRLAGIHVGDRVLIHAAAGAVGLAAVALAQRAGAEIFATAGSEEKRALLRSMGVQHVLNSRSVSFADEIMRITKGRGVDVVLNSVAGQLLDRTFDVIADDGRFLEIGKRGVWDPDRVKRLNRNIQYFIVDWGEDARIDPSRVGSWLRSLIAQFDRGELAPLPLRTFPLSEAKAVFRLMSHGQHIGKLILEHSGIQDDEGACSTQLVMEQGTYLITGGLRGLGLMTAQWLVNKGARHIVLTGRRAPDAESTEVIRELESKGAEVRIGNADVSNAEAMASLLADLRATMPPLRGVIHSAAVLDDGILLQQSWDRFGTAFASKVAGSLLLDRLTASDPLDFFVMYSSIAATLGAPGQGNYVAANSFMTGLAFARQLAGRPALSVDWGAWAGRGLAVELGINERSGHTGLGVIDPAGGFAALETALRGKQESLIIGPVDWPKMALWFSRGNRVAPIFKEIVKAAPTGQQGSTRRADLAPSGKSKPDLLKDRLAAAAPNQLRALIVEQVRRDAGRVLGLENLEMLPDNKPLNELGLDSVMAIELRNAIRTAIGKNLPTTLLFDYPTIDALTNYICRSVLEIEEAPKPAPVETKRLLAGDDLIQQIESLDDTEIDRLLNEQKAGNQTTP